MACGKVFGQGIAGVLRRGAEKPADGRQGLGYLASPDELNIGRYGILLGLREV